MSDNTEAWIAQHHEHCMDCYGLIVLGERYYETERGPLCEVCASGSGEEGGNREPEGGIQLALAEGTGGGCLVPAEKKQVRGDERSI